MGKLLLYRAGGACQSILVGKSGNTNTEIAETTTLDGSVFTYIMNTSSYFENFKPYNGLTGYVSQKDISEYNMNDYALSEISGVSYPSRTSVQTIYGKNYLISVKNNNNSSVEVNSIQFVKKIYFYDKPGNTIREKDSLVLAYFFDETVTIESGVTKTFTVNLDFFN